ncbi:MAG: hypothetical protein ABJV68_09365 [Paracoccaceae bacterium]
MTHQSNSLGAPNDRKCATVDMDLEKEAPNVVTEAGFRDLIEAGYHVEVVCKEDAYRKNSVWHGVWILRAVNDDGVEKQLVTARARRGGDYIKVRNFKTVTGLVSFLIDLGFTVIAFPVLEGQRWTFTLSQEEDGDSNS